MSLSIRSECCFPYSSKFYGIFKSSHCSIHSNKNGPGDEFYMEGNEKYAMQTKILIQYNSPPPPCPLSFEERRVSYKRQF